MKSCSIFIFLFFSLFNLYGQNGDYNWILGNQKKIGFVSLPPEVTEINNFYSTSCLASFSDDKGKILFKTNGDTLWNEFNEIVQNGTGLAGHGQGAAIILKSPLDTNIFFLILSDVLAVNNSTGYSGRGVTYSIIDKSRNVGHGSVVEKNKFISKHTTGCFGVVYSSDTNKLWLAMNFNEADSLYVYSISNNQITIPLVKQYIPKLHIEEEYSGNIRAQVRFSPDAKVLLAYSIGNPLEILSFDCTTGNITVRTVVKCAMSRAAEFSPNSKLVYFQNVISKIYEKDSQVGLLQLNLSKLKDSLIYLNHSVIKRIGLKYLKIISDCRLARDQNIYFSGYYKDTTAFLGIIKFPNEEYPFCKFDSFYIKLHNKQLNGFQYIRNSYYYGKLSNSMTIYSLAGYNLIGDFNSGFLPVFPNTKRRPVAQIQSQLGCVNQSVKLNLISGYNCKVVWDFGDGSKPDSSGMIVSHTYTQSGNYKVYAYIEHSGGKDTVSSNIRVHPLTQIDLPKDTLFCTLDTLNVKGVLAANENCIWQDSSKTLNYKITKAGLYWVTISSQFCSRTDTISVETTNCAAAPGNFCLFDSLQVDFSNSDADSANIRLKGLDTTVVLPGYFTKQNVLPGKDSVVLTYFKNGLKCSTEFEINILEAIPVFDFMDTVVCSNQILSIAYNTKKFPYFEWTDGSFNSPRVIAGAGFYKVLAKDSNHCKTMDSFHVEHFDCTLDFSDACRDSIVLFKTGANNAAQEILYFGNGDSLLSPGEYTHYVYAQNGTFQVQKIMRHTKGQLVVSKSLTIENTPDLELPKDTTMCRFSELMPQIIVPAKNYQWYGHTSGVNLRIAASGTYSLTGSNGICKTVDTVQVQVIDCDCPTWVADVFTPNGDALNEVFLPQFGCKIDQIRFRIFNRWGELVFQTNNPDNGWNAKVGDFEMAEGVFIWTLEYRATDTGAYYRKSGNVTLLK